MLFYVLVLCQLCEHLSGPRGVVQMRDLVRVALQFNSVGVGKVAIQFHHHEAIDLRLELFEFYELVVGQRWPFFFFLDNFPLTLQRKKFRRRSVTRR